MWYSEVLIELFQAENIISSDFSENYSSNKSVTLLEYKPNLFRSSKLQLFQLPLRYFQICRIALGLGDTGHC
jgi:hypothetical protein